MDKKTLIGQRIRTWLGKQNKTQADVARYLGISQPSVSDMLNGKMPFPKDKFIKTIEWLNLPAEDQNEIINLFLGIPGVVRFGVAVSADAAMDDSPLVAIGRQQHELRPIQPAQMTSIPIIGVAQALGYDRTLQPFDEFIQDNATGHAPAIGAMAGGMAAIQVDGTSMTPFYPDGTIVYFSCRETPRNGDRVIAKLKAEQALVFKLFCKTNGHVELKSIDSGGQDFSFNSPANNPFEWIYPVRYSLRDERQLDRELDNHNIDRSIKK